MPWDFWLILVFLAVLSVKAKEKLALYAVTIVFQWLLAGVVLWRGLARGLRVEEFGLASKSWVAIVLGGVVGAVVIGSLQWLNLRRIGKMEGPVPELLRKL